MTLLEELQKAHRLFVECPACGEEFPLSKASLFDATKPLLPKALAHLKNKKDELRQKRLDFKKRKVHASTKPAVSAVSSITGKVLEKIAPSLPGFPVMSADCRALFEPIDYIVFNGLSAKGKVDSIVFVDVKSGNARLGGDQRQIRKVVEAEKVRLRITPRAKEVA
jgi:predicted Holliday junction resolvase-like endonuclease